MNNVVQRILVAAKAKGFDQKRLAAVLGISPQIITDWKKGNTTSYTRYIPAISKILGVSADYLLTGENAAIQPPSDPELDEFIKKFNQLTPAERQVMFEKVDQLLSDR